MHPNLRNKQINKGLYFRFLWRQPCTRSPRKWVWQRWAMKKILMAFAAFLLVVAASPVVGRAQQPQNNQQYPPQYDNGGQWPQDQGSLPPYPNQAPPPPGQGIPYPPQGSQPQGSKGRRVRRRDRRAVPQGQQQPAGQTQPGVARLSYIHGDVSQQRGDNGEWVASTLNTPVEPGDRVTTGEGARAELATRLRRHSAHVEQRDRQCGGACAQ